MSDDWEDYERSSNSTGSRNTISQFWETFDRFGKLFTIKFDMEEVDDDYKYGNITRSKDRNDDERSFNNYYVSDRRKGRWKHQRCHEHHRPPRRRTKSRRSTKIIPLEEADYDEGERRVAAMNLDSAPNSDSGYSAEDSHAPFEPVDDNSPHAVDETESELEDFGSEPERINKYQDGNFCKCGPKTFSMENFKVKWDKFRGLVGRCYPALPCNDGDYYILPKCPPEHEVCQGDDASKGGDNEIDDDTEIDGDTEIDDDKQIGDVEDPQNQRDSSSPEFGRIFEGQRSLDVGEPLEDVHPDKTVTKQTEIEETIVCYTPEFWVKLFQIVIFAPLLAFTAYLLVEWFIHRRQYVKKSDELKHLKRQNKSLASECDRLEAFMMSTQMSPLANGKRQAKVKEDAAKIFQSLNESKQKLRELAEERSVLLEVLYNLRKPEEDNVVSSFTNPNHYNHDPMCACAGCAPPTESNNSNCEIME